VWCQFELRHIKFSFRGQLYELVVRHFAAQFLSVVSVWIVRLGFGRTPKLDAVGYADMVFWLNMLRAAAERARYEALGEPSTTRWG